jgi:hypothetical protein
MSTKFGILQSKSKEDPVTLMKISIAFIMTYVSAQGHQFYFFFRLRDCRKCHRTVLWVVRPLSQIQAAKSCQNVLIPTVEPTWRIQTAHRAITSEIRDVPRGSESKKLSKVWIIQVFLYVIWAICRSCVVVSPDTWKQSWIQTSSGW